MSRRRWRGKLSLCSIAASLHTVPPAVFVRQKAEEVALEKNRALKAALNAELRKDKGNLLDSAIPKLATIAKDMRKGSTQEAAQLRDQQV